MMCQAIEDGYFIARELGGRDLKHLDTVTNAFEAFEKIRVDYTNGHVSFAQTLGKVFHKTPWPLSFFRDMIFDHTPLLANALRKGYLDDALKETMDLSELHVDKQSRPGIRSEESANAEIY